PEVVLVADAYMLAENDGHRRKRNQPSHAGPERDVCSLRQAFQEMHPVERISAEGTTAVATDRHVQRPHVDAGANAAFNEFPLMDVAGYEIGLDAVLAQPLEMFNVEGWRRIHDHSGPCCLYLRIFHVRPFYVIGTKGSGYIPKAGARGDRYE